MIIIMLSATCCKNGNHFRNVCKVETIGETIRIETECYGDSIIKHYIDLKGTSDDGFDNSFNVTIVRTPVQVPSLSCLSKFSFDYKGFNVSYCEKELITNLKNSRWMSHLADSIGINFAIDSLVGRNNSSYLVNLIDELNSQIIDNGNFDTIKSVLRGKYITCLLYTSPSPRDRG